MITVKFTGGTDLVKRLEMLPGAVSRKVQIDALTAGTQPIQRIAARLAPRDETAPPPHLADNIVIGVVSQASLERRERFNETVVEVGPEKKFFYSFFQEYGTAHHSAQPFMRPAFDEGAPVGLNLILQQFWTAIRKLMPQGKAA